MYEHKGTNQYTKQFSDSPAKSELTQQDQDYV
jgi:hypothetical protein